MPVCVYAFLAVFAVLVVVGIIRKNRGPRELHELAARLAAKHGGTVTPGRWRRPVVQITRGPFRLTIEWWRGRLGRHRRGPLTWVTLAPVDARTSPVAPDERSLQARLAGRPGWEIEAYRDAVDETDATVWLVRLTIPGHVYEEVQLESALDLLTDAARTAG